MIFIEQCIPILKAYKLFRLIPFNDFLPFRSCINNVNESTDLVNQRQ